MLLTSNPSLASRQLREALTQLRGGAAWNLGESCFDGTKHKDDEVQVFQDFSVIAMMP
jgi:hypothetical protein